MRRHGVLVKSNQSFPPRQVRVLPGLCGGVSNASPTDQATIAGKQVHNAQMTVPLTFFDDLAFVSIDLVRHHDAWPRLVQQTAIGQILDAIAGNAGQQLSPVLFYVPRIEEGYPPQSSELMLTGRFLIGPGVRAPIWYKPVSLCKRCPVKA